MAASRTTFEKLQRDRAKKAKAEAKRAKRMGLAAPNGPLQSTTDDEPEAPVDEPQFGVNLDKELSADELLQMVETLQRQFDNNEIDFDEYEERKIELMTRLPID